MNNRTASAWALYIASKLIDKALGSAMDIAGIIEGEANVPCSEKDAERVEAELDRLAQSLYERGAKLGVQ